MEAIQYPTGIDTIWIACDRDSRVAAFITGGEGPIPHDALSQTQCAPDIESSLLLLPSTSEAHLLVHFPRPSSFLELAKRGLFVYDWQDVHSTAARATGRLSAGSSTLAGTNGRRVVCVAKGSRLVGERLGVPSSALLKS